MNTWFYILLAATALLGIVTLFRMAWDRLHGEVVDRVEPAGDGDIEIRIFEVGRVDAGDGVEAGV